MRHVDLWGFLPLLRDVLSSADPSSGGAWFRTRHTHSWPSAQGTIMSARVRSSTNSYNQPWVADLSSTYVVNGEYYSGFHRIGARSEGRTEEKIVGWEGRR